MNCYEARALLAIYRERQSDQAETTELDAHLEQCSACRQTLAHQTLVGNQLRAQPVIELPTHAYTQLMQRLANEHTRALQKAPSTTPPVPDFLKPYIQHVPAAQKQQALTTLNAFSSAETGPLPILQLQKKRTRRQIHFSQFTVVGIVAACLLMLMLSGLTSLVMFRNTLTGTSSQGVTIAPPPQVKYENYTTITPYQHVVSAVAVGQSIYYSGNGDGNWMLERLNMQTSESSPLLATPSSNPLVVLGSTDTWLIWLELDTPQQQTKHDMAQSRSWSMQALYLGAKPGSLETPSLDQGFRQPITLLSGTFTPDTLPYWVHTPIQGIWFVQQHLLIAMVDAQGSAHLLQYQLDTVQDGPPVEIASAQDGHILTSPTANSDGSAIFWSNEWMAMDGLHSTIWTQQIIDDATHKGAWDQHSVTTQYIYRADGQSFNPQIINNTLFLLNAGNSDITSGTTATPAHTTALAQTPITGGASEVTVTPRIASDPEVYTDESEVQGRLVAIPLSAPPASAQSSMPQATSLISAPQAGSGFIIYQNTDGSGMDILVKGRVTSVNVGQVPTNASFLAVNSNTAIWTMASDTADSSVTFTMFRWPS